MNLHDSDARSHIRMRRVGPMKTCKRKAVNIIYIKNNNYVPAVM